LPVSWAEHCYSTEAWVGGLAEIAQFRQDEAARRKESATRQKQDLQHRIRDLKNRPASSGRTRLVKELEKELSDA